MNSIAAAKRRRAQPDTKPNPVQANPTQPIPRPASTPALTTQTSAGPNQQRLNPQQYLLMIEARISSLEKNMGDNRPSLQIEVNTPEGKKQMDMSEYMADIDQKFMVLAEELSTLKDSMMKLQTFTMEVNQSLFSKLETPSVPVISENLVPPPNNIGMTYSPEIDNLDQTQILPSIKEETEMVTSTNEIQSIIENVNNETEPEITEDSIIGVTKKQKGKKK
tara:strand:- start:1596 stop:2258 length:663 start_codon:yes stop_codon:yes gene_type:complete